LGVAYNFDVDDIQSIYADRINCKQSLILPRQPAVAATTTTATADDDDDDDDPVATSPPNNKISSTVFSMMIPDISDDADVIDVDRCTCTSDSNTVLVPVLVDADLDLCDVDDNTGENVRSNSPIVNG